MTLALQRAAHCSVAALVASLAAATPAAGQATCSAGVRYHLQWGGPSTRAGDVPGYGLEVRRSLRGRWAATAALDRFGYDLETPVHATGLEPRAGDKPVDAFTIVTRAEIGALYFLRTGRRWSPHLGGGLGLYAIRAGAASGNTRDGGTFSLDIDTPTTVGLSGRIGSEWLVARRVQLGLLLSYAGTVGRYRVTDRVSGARGTIAPFSPLGVTAEVAFRF